MEQIRPDYVAEGAEDSNDGTRVEDGVVEHPSADDYDSAKALKVDRTWFQRAVFYEVLVRAFADSNGDGSGDLRGLIGQLDYLKWLGVDCLWLPPFYDSPLRDGGYDIRDFYKVLSDFGTVEDFVALLDEAHKRGIRVITDLVMNHTSDSHVWFQESRNDPNGPYGDFYVWSDTDDRYTDARVIFVDTEESNWTFDPVRRQFYWHRFFAHQPDLNYANPAVQREMMDVLRFWLNLGIDGFRLDAVPYLFEEEGTNCENLPETHEFLRHCRKIIDDEYPGRVLLAEANQWPADVVAYFGDPQTGGDECHMAFHFPLMPRIFMAVRRESRFPISEILAHTPAIPENCQWGIFLRNHDELTLEMVTDEERDYMYTEYAKDPRMRANVGIRRRLAPLLENDRNQIELFTALLLSLPGSPVLYYGDEIGMGDNIWLGDRDGVRTPMQWTPDRNAGFSTANPGRLYLPAIQDPIYGYQSVNVEAQRDNSASLLSWTRTMLSVRKRHEAFAAGTFRELGGSNPSVLAFLRQHGDDVVLCVNNLSRFPQPIELNLQQWAGYTPIELTGHVTFPRVGHLPYLLTLPGHGFYWFQLCGPEEQQ
jgi:maltose alpha-D-glucosyltransferase/alpha-amylase